MVLTLVAYLPVLSDRGIEFLNVDDRRYIVDTPQVTAGLHWHGIAWALAATNQSNWHPLTWMSWQLDASLYGADAWGFHVTNVVLHVTSAVLLMLVLVRASGSLLRSLTVAALFALHPLHVESVAWVSERKDVLSTVFFMLAMLAHVSYARRPGLGRYGLVLLATVLGLMAKSMLVTLPCVLLLLDVWPLRRPLQGPPPDRKAAAPGPRRVGRQPHAPGAGAHDGRPSPNPAAGARRATRSSTTSSTWRGHSGPCT